MLFTSSKTCFDGREIHMKWIAMDVLKFYSDTLQMTKIERKTGILPIGNEEFQNSLKNYPA